jgi:hypothetical protein
MGEKWYQGIVGNRKHECHKTKDHYCRKEEHIPISGAFHRRRLGSKKAVVPQAMNLIEKIKRPDGSVKGVSMHEIDHKIPHKNG